MTQVKPIDVAPPGETPAYTLAHLSDPHLTSLDGVRPGELLNKRLLGYLSWRTRRRGEHRMEVLDALVEDLHRARPDHTVITGDMTHVGLPRECRKVSEWLSSFMDPQHLTIVPGNHDAYVAAPWGKTMGLWTSYMAPDAVAGETRDTLFPALRQRGPLALIGLSTACPTPPFLATGRAGAAQLAALEQVLRETGAQGRVRVLLIHHPPLKGSIGWRKRLEDADALCGIIAREGVEVVLHGHTHRPAADLMATGRGAVPVIGVPSASAIGHKPGRQAQYHLCRFHEGQRGWRLHVSVRGYDPETGRFIHGGAQQYSLPGENGRVPGHEDIDQRARRKR